MVYVVHATIQHFDVIVKNSLVIGNLSTLNYRFKWGENIKVETLSFNIKLWSRKQL